MSKFLVISLLIVSLIIGLGVGYMISPEYAKQAVMHSNNLGNADEKYDSRFIAAMINHHEGAIDMAKDAELKSKRPEILNLANEIIEAQEKEIEMMREWKKLWYGDSK